MFQRSLKIAEPLSQGYQFELEEGSFIPCSVHLDQENRPSLISLPVFWMRRLEMSTLMGTDQWCPTNKRDVHRLHSMPCFHIWRVFENVAFPFVWKRWTKAEIERRVSEVLKMVQLADWKTFDPKIIRWSTPAGSHCPGYYQWTTSGPFRWALVCTLTWNFGQTCSMSCGIATTFGITFVFVTHDQEEALPWVTGSSKWRRDRPFGTPWIWGTDQPLCSHLYRGVQHSRWSYDRGLLIEFNGKRFEAVDGGMSPNEPVEVVIRPEDLQITLPKKASSKWRWTPSSSVVCIMRSSPMMIWEMSGWFPTVRPSWRSHRATLEPEDNRCWKWRTKTPG